MKKIKKLLSLKNIYKITFLLVFIVSFFVLLKLTTNTHLYHDEFVYSVIYGTTEKIHSFKDILISLKNLYFIHAGRFIVHAVIMILLQVPKIIRDIINSALLGILIIELIEFSKSKEKYEVKDILILLLMFPLLWTTIPVFKDVVIWFAGTMNYLFTTILLLAFLRLVRNTFLDENKVGKNKMIILSILSFIIGALHEVIGTLAIAYTGLMFLYFLIKDKKINKCLFVLIIFEILGTLSVVMAPGTVVRKLVENREADSIPTIYDNFKNSIKMFIYTIKDIPIVLSTIFVYMIIKLIKIKDSLKDKEFISNMFLIISALSVYIAMIISPIFLERVTFMPYVFFVLVFLRILNYDWKFKYSEKIKNIGISMALIILTVISFKSIKETIQLTEKANTAWTNRDEEIARQVSEGKKDIYLDMLGCEYNDYMYGGDLATSISVPVNRSTAAYYEVDSVRINLEYYCDLRINNINENNAKSISLNADNYSENKVIYMLDKELYDTVAPYKKQKYAAVGENVTLDFAMPNISNLYICFSEPQEIEISGIKLYTKDNVLSEKEGKVVLENMQFENVELISESDDEIILKVNENGKIYLNF